MSQSYLIISLVSTEWPSFQLNYFLKRLVQKPFKEVLKESLSNFIHKELPFTDTIIFKTL